MRRVFYLHRWQVLLLFFAIALYASAQEKAPPVRVVSICAAEVGNAQCEWKSKFQSNVSVETHHLSESEFSPGGLEKLVCSLVQNNADPVGIYVLSGKGKQIDETSWEMYWLGRAGEVGSPNPMRAKSLLDAFKSCAKGDPRPHVMISGCLGGGLSWSYKTVERSHYPQFKVTTDYCLEPEARIEGVRSLQTWVNYSIRDYVEKKVADAGTKNSANWGLLDIPYPPNDEPSLPCRRFYQAMLKQDWKSVLQGDYEKLPHPGQCEPLPLFWTDQHYYLQDCHDQPSHRLTCVRRFMHYFSRLKHWATRDEPLSSIQDTKLLWLKFVGLSGIVPDSAAKETQQERQRLLHRMLELEPRNEAVLNGLLQNTFRLAELDSRQLTTAESNQVKQWAQVIIDSSADISLHHRRRYSAWFHQDGKSTFDEGRLTLIGLKMLQSQNQYDQARGAYVLRCFGLKHSVVSAALAKIDTQTKSQFADQFCAGPSLGDHLPDIELLAIFREISPHTLMSQATAEYQNSSIQR